VHPGENADAFRDCTSSGTLYSMPSSTAAIVDGFEYQFLYSWYELLSLLDVDGPYDRGRVEHDQAGSADDVVLHARPGSGAVDRYVQVKWHVDHRASYSFDSLVTVAPNQRRSLLKKLFDSWKEDLGGADDVEVWLVTTWSLDPDLGGCVSNDRLGTSFFDKGDRTDIGKARARWEQEVGPDLERFARCLRFRPGLDVSLLETMVSDRMSRYGLRTGPDAQRRGVDAVRRWIRADVLTRETLQHTIAARDLLADREGAPRVALWIHGWVKQSYGGAPTRELDWTPHFSGSKRPTVDDSLWRERLLPELLAAKAELSAMEGGRTIDLRGKLLQTALLAIGAELPARAGFVLRVEQESGGQTALWRSDVGGPSDRDFMVDRREVGDGKDVLVVLAISGDISADADAFLLAHPGQFHQRILAVPDVGPSQQALASNKDAIALVDRARDLLGEAKRARRPGGRIHLIPCGPAAFSLFLGQRLNALGDIVTYERSSDEGYQPSVTLRTG